MYNPINGKQAFDDIVILNGYVRGSFSSKFSFYSFHPPTFSI